MADQTIQIPPHLVHDIRRSLLHVYSGIAEAASHSAARLAVSSPRDDEAVQGRRVELADAADALDQLGWVFEPAHEAMPVSAHPELLCDVLAQSLHDLAETFERAVEQASSAERDTRPARLALEDLQGLLELFEQTLGVE